MICLLSHGDDGKMRPMILKSTRIKHVGLCGLIAVLMAGINTIDLAAADEDISTCPWIVQPDEPLVGLGANNAAYEILFNGQTTDAIFYGFTVADHKLARQLTNNDGIPDLRQNGRSLKTIEKEGIIAYQVSTDSILPRTIYLLTATKSMPQLERIDARIDPARPIAVGLRTRGATDLNGPMPRRTVPGVEILASSPQKYAEDRSIVLSSLGLDFQLCAYQVSWN